MGLGHWLVNKVGAYLSKEEPPKRSYLCDFGRICHEIRPADVLLVEGRNKISHIIQRITHSPWSHSALYIGRIHDIEDPMLRELVHRHYDGQTSDQLLLEALVGQGTVIVPITKYKNDHIRICRPAGISYRDAQQVIAYGVKQIGHKYNIRQFFDLGRFLLASHFLPRRWKSSIFSYNAGQATQDICSTMIAAAFNSIQFPILPLIRKNQNKNTLELIHRNPRLFAPSDFDYSPYFNIIKYPIFPGKEPNPYRNLPWREGLIYSDEVGITENIPPPISPQQEQPKEPKKSEESENSDESDQSSSDKPTSH